MFSFKKNKNITSVGLLIIFLASIAAAIVVLVKHFKYRKLYGSWAPIISGILFLIAIICLILIIWISRIKSEIIPSIFTYPIINTNIAFEKINKINVPLHSQIIPAQDISSQNTTTTTESQSSNTITIINVQDNQFSSPELAEFINRIIKEYNFLIERNEKLKKDLFAEITDSDDQKRLFRIMKRGKQNLGEFNDPIEEQIVFYQQEFYYNSADSKNTTPFNQIKFKSGILFRPIESQFENDQNGFLIFEGNSENPWYYAEIRHYYIIKENFYQIQNRLKQ